ncbi:MAG: tetratricopeptide repeat protein [Balneola sp.]
MKKNLFRLFSFAVLAIIIISCGGESNPLIKEAKDGIKAQNYDAALVSLEQALVQDSANADAYYYKGVVYSEMAQNNPNISDRKDSYSKMRENLLTAKNMYETQGIQSVESVEAQVLIDRKWSEEHNLGVKYATGDSTLAPSDNPLDTAEDHLENAVVINPDSLLSFEVLAEVYRLNSNTEMGIKIYEDLITMKDEPEAYDYDRLGALYLNLEQYNKAKEVLIDGVELFPDSVSLVQKLADSYMKLGENQESIEVIESLIERDPNNPQYHLVLGTQVYIMASEITDDISSKYDEIFNLEREQRNLSGNAKKANQDKVSSLRTSIQDQSQRADQLIDRAIQELKKVIEVKPDDSNAYNTLGIIYQNKAAALFDKRNATADNDEAAKIDNQAKDNLREAMKNYEKATEIEPDNQSYWRSLFQVYTSLGMNEKAEAAMEKAGM